MSDDEDEEQVAETGEDGKELIENEIFGGDDDDEDAGSVIQQSSAAVPGQTEFDLEQSDEESGVIYINNNNDNDNMTIYDLLKCSRSHVTRMSNTAQLCVSQLFIS